jgi:hypothetical protein
MVRESWMRATVVRGASAPVCEGCKRTKPARLAMKVAESKTLGFTSRSRVCNGLQTRKDMTLEPPPNPHIDGEPSIRRPALQGSARLGSN